MSRQKLINYLKTLNSKELIKLNDYVKSPIFNKNKNCIKLLEIFSKAFPNYHTSALSNEALSTKLFPKKSKSISNLSNLMTQSVKLIERFLAFLTLEENEYLQKELQMLALEERGNMKRVLKYYNVPLKTQGQSYAYYQHQYTCKQCLYNLQYIHSQSFQISMQEVFDMMTISYTIKQLRHYCAIINDAKYRGIIYNENMVHVTISQIPEKIILIPAVRAYYNVLLLVTYETQEKYFQNLQFSLSTDINYLPKHEQRFVYNILLNYCTRRLKEGKLTYRTNIFEYYQHMLDKKLLYKGDYLNEAHVKNIVTIGLKEKQFVWVKQFIEDYKNEVEPSIRKSVYKFNLGLLHFYQEQYSIAHDFFNEVEVCRLSYQLDGKALLLKKYYELDEFIAFDSLTESFRKLLANKKRTQQLTTTTQKAYQNFSKLIIRLFKVKHGISKKPLEKLVVDIQTVSPNSDKQWLLEKAKNL